MRVSRIYQLPQNGGIVHKFWRTHNKEFLLRNEAIKNLYLQSIRNALHHQSINKKVKLVSYCIMDNHSHQVVSYEEKSKNLSKFMQLAHSSFGQSFNKKFNRQGSVAYDRPKTPVIQANDWHQMRVHFYIEANPIRAKMVKNLKLYKYCSFKFYAWGIRDEFTDLLEIPIWYLNLGKTAKQRQSKYRSLFNAYLMELLQRDPCFTHTLHIGNPIWIQSQRRSLRLAIKKKLNPPDH